MELIFSCRTQTRTSQHANSSTLMGKSLKVTAYTAKGLGLVTHIIAHLVNAPVMFGSYKGDCQVEQMLEHHEDVFVTGVDFLPLL